MPDNSKIFVTAPDSAPALAFLPTTDNHAFDAAVLLCLLTDSTSAPLVKRLLEWQNRLRMLLLDLFAARRDASKVSCTQAQIPFLKIILFPSRRLWQCVVKQHPCQWLSCCKQPSACAPHHHHIIIKTWHNEL